MAADLYVLDQIQSRDRHDVGDKAFYLAECHRRGYPITPGWVIATDLFQEIMARIEWIEPLFADFPESSLHLDVQSPRQLQNIARQIRQAILTTPPLPRLQTAMATILTEATTQPWDNLMVRPSLIRQGTVDPLLSDRLAGLLCPHLCRATAAGLQTALYQSWAELFRARSLLYWQRSGIPLQQVQLALLVQPVVDATTSGTLQVNPEQMQLQAIAGLGLALSTGDATPVEWQVPRPLAAALTFPPPVEIQGLRYHLRVAQPPDRAISAWSSAPIAPDKTQHPPPTPLGAIGTQPDWAECLTADWYEATAHLTTWLPPAVWHQILTWGDRAATEFGHPLRLDWVYGQLADRAAQLYVAQVYPTAPHPSGGTAGLVSSAKSAGHALAAPASTDPRSPAASTRTNGVGVPSVTLNRTDTGTITTGLAAAPGQARGTAFLPPATSLTVPTEMPPDAVIVATHITPDWLPWLRRARGIISEQGGRNCHGAIIARELGIPAVVGVAAATQTIPAGAAIAMDGDRGWVKLLAGEGYAPAAASQSPVTASAAPDPTNADQNAIALTATPVTRQHATLQAAWRAAGDLPETGGETLPTATQLWTNMSQVSTLQRLPRTAIDGIGLLRSELMVLDCLDGQSPQVFIQQRSPQAYVDRIAAQVEQFAAALAPRPVCYRSLDWRSHEFARLSGITPSDTNPILGMRGTFSYQVDPTLFDLELQALRQVQRQGYSNLRLILPFVRTVSEVQFCYQRLIQAGLLHSPGFELWMMAEVPSVLFLLPQYVEAGIQGIAIGTNDLTQLLLGVDRDHPQLSQQFDANHPAVRAAVAQLIQTARSLHIPCSICGQALGDQPDLVDFVVRQGIDAISVEVDALPRTRRAILRAEKRLLLAAERSPISPHSADD